MSQLLSPEALAAANAHAIKEYPNESCGLLVDGEYKSCFNYASLPTQDFAIASEIWHRLEGEGRHVGAVIHSHPDGPDYPSERDMQGQIDTDIPWVIIPTNGAQCASPVIWGHEIAPIIGRSFVHGVSDCYTLIEDCYALGKIELEKQGIPWPFPSRPLPAFPRNDSWWEDRPNHPGDDLYTTGYAKAGFEPVAFDHVKPGDVFLCAIRSKQLNHGGVLIENGLILHHLPNRLSKRDPAGIWGRAADLWLRKVR